MLTRYHSLEQQAVAKRVQKELGEQYPPKTIVPSIEPAKEFWSEVAVISIPNTFRWLGGALFDWALIALSFCAVYRVFKYAHDTGYSVLSLFITVGVTGLAILVIGMRQHALVILGHDGAHGSVHHRLWLNDLITGLFAFWPMTACLSGYRRFHFTHHQNLGSDNDPELYHKHHAGHRYDLPASVARIITLSCKALFLADGLVEEFLVLEYIAIRDKKLELVGPLLWWSAAITLIWYYRAWWILPIWFAALGSSYWAMFRLRIWTEHMGTPDVHRIYVRPLLRFFTPHNTWYHYEHHKWTRVPYWNLPKARKLDSSVPVRTVEDLFSCYEHLPFRPGGMPFKKSGMEPFSVLTKSEVATMTDFIRNFQNQAL